MMIYLVIGAFAFIGLNAIVIGLWIRIKEIKSRNQYMNDIESLDKDQVFNIERFNEWFCDPNNNATYAHKGIFGRTDKLSNSHIYEYLQEVWNIQEKIVNESDIYSFYNKIRENWKKL